MTSCVVVQSLTFTGYDGRTAMTLFTGHAVDLSGTFSRKRTLVLVLQMLSELVYH